MSGSTWKHGPRGAYYGFYKTLKINKCPSFCPDSPADSGLTARWAARLCFGMGKSRTAAKSQVSGSSGSKMYYQELMENQNSWHHHHHQQDGGGETGEATSPAGENQQRNVNVVWWTPRSSDSLLVGWFIGPQNYSKPNRWFSTKPVGRPMKTWNQWGGSQ